MKTKCFVNQEKMNYISNQEIDDLKIQQRRLKPATK
jgi:hypothetical protein